MHDIAGRQFPHHPTSQEPHLQRTSVISYFLTSGIAASVVIAGVCIPLSTSLVATVVFCCCWLFLPVSALKALLIEAHNLDSVAPIFE